MQKGNPKQLTFCEECYYLPQILAPNLYPESKNAPFGMVRESGKQMKPNQMVRFGFRGANSMPEFRVNSFSLLRMIGIVGITLNVHTQNHYDTSKYTTDKMYQCCSY